MCGALLFFFPSLLSARLDGATLYHAEAVCRQVFDLALVDCIYDEKSFFCENYAELQLIADVDDRIKKMVIGVICFADVLQVQRNEGLEFVELLESLISAIERSESPYFGHCLSFVIVLLAPFSWG